MKKSLKIGIFGLGAVGLLAGLYLIVLAATSYQVNSGATVIVDEFSTCQKVTNNHASGLSLFVPTNTTGEWSAFRSNLPAGVTLDECVSGYYLGDLTVSSTGDLAYPVYGGQITMGTNSVCIRGGWGTNGLVKATQCAGWNGSTLTSWTKYSSAYELPIALGHFKALVDGSALYAIGGNTGSGYSDVVYKTVNGGFSWTNVGNLPTELQGPQTVVIGDYVYLLGGYKSGSQDYVYRAQKSRGLTSWTVLGDLPNVLSGSHSAVIGDIIYLFGGSIGANVTKNVVHSPVPTPPSTPSWTTTADALSLPKQAGNLAIIGNYIYLFGGHDGTSYNDDVLRASISNPTSWTNLGDLIPGSALGWSHLFIIGDRLYIVGGYNGSAATDQVLSAPITGSGGVGDATEVSDYNDPWVVKSNY